MLSKILARSSLGIRFWSMYAKAYDTLLSLKPYTAMLAEVVAEVGMPPGPRGKEGAAVLDAGCGSGNLTRLLVNAGYRVQAVDSSSGMLERASRKCPGASCHLADLDRPLPFPDSSFDAITCSNVLYSLPNPERSLIELERLLKPGGRIILTNPTPHFSMGQVLARHWAEQNLWGRVQFLLRVPSLLVLTGFNMMLLHKGQKRQFHFLSPEQMESLLARVGYHAVEIRPTYADQGWLVRARKLPVVSLLSSEHVDFERTV